MFNFIDPGTTVEPESEEYEPGQEGDEFYGLMSLSLIKPDKTIEERTPVNDPNKPNPNPSDPPKN